MLRKLSFVVGVFVLAAFVHAAPAAQAQDADLHAVRGTVVDDAGAPIAGAYVYGYTGDGGREGSADKAMTAEDGTFTLRLASGKGQLTASHDKFRQPAYLDLLVDGDEAGLQLVLPRPPPRNAIVEGVVTAADGTPVEGAHVTIGQGCCYAYEDSPDKVAVPTSPSPETAVSGGGSDGSAGNATPSAAMTRPAIWHDGDHQTFTTGADGRYRFETYPGPRQVTAYAEGYAQSSTTVEARENASVTANLKLEKMPATDALLDLRVVDARTGLPLAGAGVSIQNLEWSHYQYGTTDRDGRVKLTTLPGWTSVNVYYHGGNEAVSSDAGVASDLARPGGSGKQYYAYVKTLDLESGANAHEAKLDPKPDPTVVLTGYVVDPEAKTGVPNAQVSVWNQDTGDWGSATTDATGSYRILVRPGHYTMNSWAQGHLPGSTMFVIEDGETAKRVDIESPEGEQKHAPCIDYCARPLAAETMAKDVDGGAGYATTAGGPAPAMDEAATRTATSDAAQSPGGADGTRGTAYQGSGGGLPPYSPASAETETPPQAQVPGAGVAAALAVLGVLALALRRRG